MKAGTEAHRRRHKHTTARQKRIEAETEKDTGCERSTQSLHKAQLEEQGRARARRGTTNNLQRPDAPASAHVARTHVRAPRGRECERTGSHVGGRGGAVGITASSAEAAPRPAAVRIIRRRPAATRRTKAGRAGGTEGRTVRAARGRGLRRSAARRMLEGRGRRPVFSSGSH
jgi:hypothetical protein